MVARVAIQFLELRILKCCSAVLGCCGLLPGCCYVFVNVFKTMDFKMLLCSFRVLLFFIRIKNF